MASVMGNAAQPDPMDANAEVPAVKYRPAFVDYRGYREAKIGEWRQLNNAASQKAADTGAAAEQPAQSPEMLAPHSGHPMDHKEQRP